MVSTDVIGFVTFITVVLFVMHMHDNSILEQNEHIYTTCVSTDTVYGMLDFISNTNYKFELFPGIPVVPEFVLIFTRDTYKKNIMTPECLRRQVRPIPATMYINVLVLIPFFRHVVYSLTTWFNTPPSHEQPEGGGYKEQDISVEATIELQPPHWLKYDSLVPIFPARCSGSHALKMNDK